MSKIKNQAIADLRFFKAKALKKIKSIINCAVTYLPENPEEEWMPEYPYAIAASLIRAASLLINE